MTPNLLADLRRDEGLRLAAYPDPLSGGAPWTIGYGHTGPEVCAGLHWTPAQAETALAADVARTAAELDAKLPWWREVDPVRQDVMVNLAFNLGVHGLSKFHNLIELLREGAFEAAADDLAMTLWAREVGDRAARLIAQLRTGVHQP